MELKKCPFCGGEADLFYARGKNGFFVFVQCTMCNSQSKTFGVGKILFDDWVESQASKSAVNVWNTRVGDVYGR